MYLHNCGVQFKMTNRCDNCGHAKKLHHKIENIKFCNHTNKNAEWDCDCTGWKYLRLKNNFIVKTEYGARIVRRSPVKRWKW